METRALAIAFFYAIGTAVGGISGPLLFGDLIGSGKPGQVAIAFYIGSGVMALGGLAEIAWGISAERRQLEDVAKPLTVEEAEAGDGQHAPGTKTDGGAPEADEGTRRARTQAAELRGQSSDHVAAMHRELAAAHGRDEQALDRAEQERALAEIASLSAQAFDQDAIAAQEETALAPDSPQDAERAGSLAEAHGERALAEEQLAEAELTAGSADGAGDAVRSAVRNMHRAWARLHQARARLSKTRARDLADLTTIRESDAALEQALAAEAEVSAAEHREDARREDPAQEPSSAVGPERAEHLDQVQAGRADPVPAAAPAPRLARPAQAAGRDQAGRSAARRPSQRRRRPRPNCWTTRSPPSNGCSPSGVRCRARRSSVWSAPGTGVPASSAGPWPRPLPTAPYGGSGATPTPPNPRTDPRVPSPSRAVTSRSA